MAALFRPSTPTICGDPAEGVDRAPYGVEPICKVLPIAPSTDREHVVKRTDPRKMSARAKWNLEPKPEIERVFGENFEVYGARKVWR